MKTKGLGQFRAVCYGDRDHAGFNHMVQLSSWFNLMSAAGRCVCESGQLASLLQPPTNVLGDDHFNLDYYFDNYAGGPAGCQVRSDKEVVLRSHWVSSTVQ